MKMIKKRYTFLIICTIFSVLFFYFNQNLFYSNNYVYLFESIFSSFFKNKNEVIDLDNIIQQNFVKFGNDIASISNSEFLVLSQNLQEKLKINHNFEFPMVKCSKYKALIFDSLGTKYMITSRTKVLHSGNLGKKIISGKISERDNIVFITESDKYCCEMEVKDLKGNDKFHYCFAKMYVINVSINDAGDKVAIQGMKAEDGKIKSVIQIFDIKSKFPIFTKEFDDIFFSIDFFNNKNLMVIGDHLTMCIKNLGEKINELRYQKKQLCLYSFDKDFGAAISFSPSNDDRNQYILIIDKNCKQLFKIETGKKLKSIFLKNKILTCLSENQVSIFKNSQLQLQKTVSPECINAMFLPYSQSVALLTHNQIKIINKNQD